MWARNCRAVLARKCASCLVHRVSTENVELSGETAGKIVKLLDIVTDFGRRADVQIARQAGGHARHIIKHEIDGEGERRFGNSLRRVRLGNGDGKAQKMGGYSKAGKQEHESVRKYVRPL